MINNIKTIVKRLFITAPILATVVHQNSMAGGYTFDLENIIVDGLKYKADNIIKIKKNGNIYNIHDWNSTIGNFTTLNPISYGDTPLKVSNIIETTYTPQPTLSVESNGKLKINKGWQTYFLNLQQNKEYAIVFLNDDIYANSAFYNSLSVVIKENTFIVNTYGQFWSHYAMENLTNDISIRNFSIGNYHQINGSIYRGTNNSNILCEISQSEDITFSNNVSADISLSNRANSPGYSTYNNGNVVFVNSGSGNITFEQTTSMYSYNNSLSNYAAAFNTGNTIWMKTGTGDMHFKQSCQIFSMISKWNTTNSGNSTWENTGLGNMIFDSSCDLYSNITGEPEKNTGVAIWKNSSSGNMIFNGHYNVNMYAESPAGATWENTGTGKIIFNKEGGIVDITATSQRDGVVTWNNNGHIEFYNSAQWLSYLIYASSLNGTTRWLNSVNGEIIIKNGAVVLFGAISSNSGTKTSKNYGTIHVQSGVFKLFYDTAAPNNTATFDNYGTIIIDAGATIVGAEKIVNHGGLQNIDIDTSQYLADSIPSQSSSNNMDRAAIYDLLFEKTSNGYKRSNIERFAQYSCGSIDYGNDTSRLRNIDNSSIAMFATTNSESIDFKSQSLAINLSGKATINEAEINAAFYTEDGYINNFGNLGVINENIILTIHNNTAITSNNSWYNGVVNINSGTTTFSSGKIFSGQVNISNGAKIVIDVPSDEYKHPNINAQGEDASIEIGANAGALVRFRDVIVDGGSIRLQQDQNNKTIQSNSTTIGSELDLMNGAINEYNTGSMTLTNDLDFKFDIIFKTDGTIQYDKITAGSFTSNNHDIIIKTTILFNRDSSRKSNTLLYYSYSTYQMATIQKFYATHQ